MDEAEWLECDDSQEAARAILNMVSDRKVRLFACACCFELWHLLPDVCRDWVEVSEAFADDPACRGTLERSHQAIRDAHRQNFGLVWEQTRQHSAYGIADGVCHGKMLHIAETVGHAIRLSARRSIGLHFKQILSDIVGNPFRPAALDPAWRTSTVRALAGGIYADRAFDRLPVLADALEDAGCDNPDVLAHCRGDGPHVRGCWVVDLVLGRT